MWTDPDLEENVRYEGIFLISGDWKNQNPNRRRHKIKRNKPEMFFVISKWKISMDNALERIWSVVTHHKYSPKKLSKGNFGFQSGDLI